MEARGALQTIQTVLRQIDADLSFVQNQLRDEFSRLYAYRDRTSASSAHLNPLNLLERLRALQQTLPVLREALLRIHHKKTTIATLMRHNLATLHAHATSLLPIAAPNLSASAGPGAEPPTPARTALHEHLSQELHSSDKQLHDCLSAFLRVHARLTQVFPDAFPKLATDDLDLALLRAAVASSDAQQQPLQPLDQNVQAGSTNAETVGDEQSSKERPTGEKSKAAMSKKAPPRNGSKKTKPPVPKPSAVVRSESPSGFRPVEKAVYNRLPRNLKIKAGKLPEINAFYQKVWNVLAGAGGSMGQKKLLAGLGESDSVRLDVLRGLAVVRHNKDGWSLA